jgi:MFS family permease
MHGRRAFAAAAAAGLLVSLFAPWYRETVVARGLHGLRTLTLTRSGWQAFSATELLVLIVAVLTLLVAIGMPSKVPQDGVPDRWRLSGVVIAALGALAFAAVLARLATAPGTTKHELDETMVAIRWGIFLALACCAALTAAGLRLASRHSARAAGPERPPRAERTPRPERGPRPKRAPRADRLARDDRASREDRAPAPDRARSDRPFWDEQTTGWLDLPD